LGESVYCIMGNTISYPVSISQSSHLCNTFIQSPKCLFLSDRQPVYVKLPMMIYWRETCQVLNTHNAFMKIKKNSNSHTFVSCCINCMFLLWVISNTEVIMTRFKALCQYLSKKTSSRSHKKRQTTSLLYCLRHLACQTGWIQINVHKYCLSGPVELKWLLPMTVTISAKHDYSSSIVQHYVLRKQPHTTCQWYYCK